MKTFSKKYAKKPKILIWFLIISLIFVYLFGYRPYTKIKQKASLILASGKELKSAFAKNDIDLLKSKLDAFAKQYESFQTEAKAVYWASFIPYVSDFKNGIEAGSYLIKAGQEAVLAIAPYADLIGFKKGETSFVERSAEDRLQTAVLTLDKVLAKIDIVSEDIRQAGIRIDKINPARYPKTIGKTVIRDRIITLKDQFSGLSSLFVDAKPLLKSLPDILGKNKEKTYLLLFQNDKERRATGGFLTAYAVFKVKNGKISIDRSEDIYSLDASISSHPRAPNEILTYHKNVYQFYIRDSNLSPDFVKSLELFNSLYKKSNEKEEYDGIIAVDSKILVDMLTIFGDTEADGILFSSRLDARCDCPQVLYTLFDIVDRPTPYIKENRKGILGDLMYALFYKAIGFSPSKYWGVLLQTMFKNLEEKHILLYFTDGNTQQSVERLNFAGRIRDYSGDYLHINNVNFAGAKSNMFITESFESKTTIEPDKLKRQVTIVFRNPHPHSDCNLERGGLCLNAPLRNWIRIYVPAGSKLVNFQGSTKKVQVYEDLRKTVFEGFLTVDPLGMAQVIVNYTVPLDKIKLPNTLLIQKQPGTYDQKLKVEINGKTIYDGLLDKDKELKQ